MLDLFVFLMTGFASTLFTFNLTVPLWTWWIRNEVRAQHEAERTSLWSDDHE